MHYLVRLIIEADDAPEANNQAEWVVDDLLEWKEFDWYYTSADDSGWEDCWKPVRLNTKKGRAMVDEAMREQPDEFKLSIEAIRHMVTHYTDEQLFNEEFEQNVPGHYLSRYQFAKASGYHRNSCQLFNTDAGSITNQKELDLYLNKPKGLWVVQVDCHN